MINIFLMPWPLIIVNYYYYTNAWPNEFLITRHTKEARRATNVGGANSEWDQEEIGDEVIFIIIIDTEIIFSFSLIMIN